ncbi:unnamed protein product [Parnassius mnemosyne]|uniref:Uncharacterized protein n=1 Tax=Parnassius mnemosyne TaxID=213953 RepID=A0AAV1M6N4_9NEOP
MSSNSHFRVILIRLKPWKRLGRYKLLLTRRLPPRDNSRTQLELRCNDNVWTPPHPWDVRAARSIRNETGRTSLDRCTNL